MDACQDDNGERLSMPGTYDGWTVMACGYKWDTNGYKWDIPILFLRASNQVLKIPIHKITFQNLWWK